MTFNRFVTDHFRSRVDVDWRDVYPWTWSLVDADEIAPGTAATWISHMEQRPAVVTNVDRKYDGEVTTVHSKELVADSTRRFHLHPLASLDDHRIDGDRHAFYDAPTCGMFMLLIGVALPVHFIIRTYRV